jgi:hypothetical protein
MNVGQKSKVKSQEARLISRLSGTRPPWYAGVILVTRYL